MSEGTAREIIERAAKQACESGELTSGCGIYWLIAKYVDAALTEAGALAPAGLSDPLYRRCPECRGMRQVSVYEQGPNATHSEPCRTCKAWGFVPVAPAADPAGEPS